MSNNITDLGALLDAASSKQTSNAAALRHLREARSLLDEGGFTFAGLVAELKARPSRDYAAELDRMVSTFDALMRKLDSRLAAASPNPRVGIEKATEARKANADLFAKRVRAKITEVGLTVRSDPKLIAHKLNGIEFRTATGKYWDAQGVRNALRRGV